MAERWWSSNDAMIMLIARRTQERVSGRQDPAPRSSQIWRVQRQGSHATDWRAETRVSISESRELRQEGRGDGAEGRSVWRTNVVLILRQYMINIFVHIVSHRNLMKLARSLGALWLLRLSAMLDRTLVERCCAGEVAGLRGEVALVAE